MERSATHSDVAGGSTSQSRVAARHGEWAGVVGVYVENAGGHIDRNGRRSADGGRSAGDCEGAGIGVGHSEDSA